MASAALQGLRNTRLHLVPLFPGAVLWVGILMWPLVSASENEPFPAHFHLLSSHCLAADSPYGS